MFDENGFGRKRISDGADMDITPMIDVVFLLLIFFMVTSTMQGTPDKDIPPASSGTNATTAGFIEVAISAPLTPGSEGEILLDGNTATIESVKTLLLDRASDPEVKVMIYADRDVKSGFVGEVEQVIGEVAQETGKEILMNFAVRDKR